MNFDSKAEFVNGIQGFDEFLLWVVFGSFHVAVFIAWAWLTWYILMLFYPRGWRTLNQAGLLHNGYMVGVVFLSLTCASISNVFVDTGSPIHYFFKIPLVGDGLEFLFSLPGYVGWALIFG